MIGLVSLGPTCNKEEQRLADVHVQAPRAAREKPTDAGLHSRSTCRRYRSKQPGHTAYAGGFFFCSAGRAWRAQERIERHQRQPRTASARSARELIQVRARLSREERAERSRAIAERAAALPELLAARTVALYAPLNTEVDPAGIARRLVGRGAPRRLPAGAAGGGSSRSPHCDPTALVRGPLGALEPPAEAPGRSTSADIDAVLMPGSRLLRDGLRLGRGGGYYDATLKLIPARSLRVGLGFDVQVVPTLPREPHDVPLDALVTESRTLRFPLTGSRPAGEFPRLPRYRT